MQCKIIAIDESSPNKTVMEEVNLHIVSFAIDEVKLYEAECNKKVILEPEQIRFFAINVSTQSLRTCNDFRYLLDKEIFPEDERCLDLTVRNYSLGKGVECVIEGAFLQSLQNYVYKMQGSFLKLQIDCTGIPCNQSYSSYKFSLRELFTPANHFHADKWENQMSCVLPAELLYMHAYRFELCLSFRVQFAKINVEPGSFHSFQLNPAKKHKKAIILNSVSSKLLHEGFQSDVIIVSSDATEFKCHKLFLTACSPVFAAMLKGGNFQEGQSRRINVVDIDDCGIRGMLLFMYGDHSQFFANIKTADDVSSLLKAADKYNIKSLQDVVTEFIIEKPNHFFTVDSALRLYSCLQRIPNMEHVSGKVLQYLRQNIKTTKESAEYVALFRDDHEVAMSLCNDLLKVAF